MLNLEETLLYGINEEEDWKGCFNVNQFLNERDGTFNSKKGGGRIDIYVKEVSGNEPHIHLRDSSGNICRIKLRENSYKRDKYDKNDKTKQHCLDKDEEEAFSEYMHRIIPGSKNTTEWERLALIWNSNWASNNKGTGGLVDISKGCPSYNKITEPD